MFYYENAHSEPFVIGKAAADDGGASGYCELVVTVYPHRKEEIEMEPAMEREVDMTQSIYGAFSNENAKKSGPFSAKRVIHESDTPHARQPQEDSEELIIPGDREEINDFVQTTTENSRIQIEIQLPTVSLQLISKHIYEVVYNRVNNDLLLWEPSAPKPQIANYDKFIPNTTFIQETQDTFAMCKSGIQYGILQNTFCFTTFVHAFVFLPSSRFRQ